MGNLNTNTLEFNCSEYNGSHYLSFTSNSSDKLPDILELFEALDEHGIEGDTVDYIETENQGSNQYRAVFHAK